MTLQKIKYLDFSLLLPIEIIDYLLIVDSEQKKYERLK